MNTPRNITLVPNYAIKDHRGWYVLAPSENALVRDLLDLDVKVQVFALCTSDSSEPPTYRLPKSPSLTIHGVRVNTRRGRIRKVYDYIRFAISALQNVFRDDSTLYVFYPGNVALPVLLVALLRRRKFGIYVRGDWGYRVDFRWIGEFVFRRAEFIVATGMGFVEQLKRFNKRVQPVSPMISFSAIGSSKKNYEIEGEANLLYVGRMVREKGIFEILEAAARLRDAGIPIKVTMAGGGSEYENALVETEIRRQGLSDSVECLGFVAGSSELSELFRDCDIFVFPSYYVEGFPRVVYEAMVFGCPIVCTILPGMRGLMRNRENCVGVLGGQPTELVRELRNMISDIELRTKLGTQAQEDVRNYLDNFEGVTHARQICAEVS